MEPSERIEELAAREADMLGRAFIAKHPDSIMLAAVQSAIGPHEDAGH